MVALNELFGYGKSAQLFHVFRLAQVLFAIGDTSTIQTDKPGLRHEADIRRRIFLEDFFPTSLQRLFPIVLYPINTIFIV